MTDGERLRDDDTDALADALAVTDGVGGGAHTSVSSRSRLAVNETTHVRTPSAVVARPSGPEKDAAGPAPSTDPATPVPATVVTLPVTRLSRPTVCPVYDVKRTPGLPLERSTCKSSGPPGVSARVVTAPATPGDEKATARRRAASVTYSEPATASHRMPCGVAKAAFSATGASAYTQLPPVPASVVTMAVASATPRITQHVGSAT